eukprot:364551_1
MSSESQWTSRANIPFIQDRSKFVIAFDDTSNELYAIRQNIENDGLLKYSFTNDEWIKYTIEPPLNLKRYNDYRDCSAPTTAIDSQRKIIYLYDHPFAAKIKLFDTNNNCKLECIDTGGMFIGCAPNGTIINNEFHVIGCNNHYKFDEQSNQFEFLQNLSDMNADNESETESETEWVENPGFVKVNDNKMLIFGGQNVDKHYEWYFNYTDSIYECNVMNNEYKWTKLDIKIPGGKYEGFGCTTILNGKYVLVMGGESVYDGGGSSSDDIYIYNVGNRTFNKSRIKCPQGGQYKAITVSDKEKDEMISFGYVRSLWKEFDINDQIFPPQYLVRIINNYYFDEFVHLFFSSLDGYRDGPGAHYKISVFDIID